MLKPLTTRQSQFVDAYLRGVPAAQAAREAGYAPSHAAKAAEQILTIPQVRAAVDAAQQQLRERAVYDVDQAVAEINDLILFARNKGNPMAAAKLTELKCKLFGLLVERLDVRQATVNVAEALAEARARVTSRIVKELNYGDEKL